LKKEGKIIKNLVGDRNVIGFVALHDFEDQMVLVMDYAGGGTLLDFLQGRLNQAKSNKMPELSHLKGYVGGNIRDSQVGEEKAKIILKSILLGVKHIH